MQKCLLKLRENGGGGHLKVLFSHLPNAYECLPFAKSSQKLV